MLTTNKPLLNSGILRGVQVLVVDNDRDNRDLYALLLEDCGAKVTTFSSIKATLDYLDYCTPDILICEIRFLGESVHPLIQQIRDLVFSRGRAIPILVISTCSPTNLAQQLRVKVEAYLLKPFDIDYFVDKVLDLALLSSIAYPLKIQDWVTKYGQNVMSCSRVS